MVVDTPPGMHHFRDPKVWREGDSWYMIVGAREGDTGQVRLYRSADLRQWQDAGVLDEAESTMGYMWECPDFFNPQRQTRSDVFPQGMQAAGFSNRNLFQSGYLIGEWQPGQRFIRHGEFREMDNGHDFYAPQSFATPDGRRIVIGWLDMWESPLPEQQDGWAGMLSLPRELSLSADDRLQMRPAKGSGEPARRLVPVAGQHPEQPADDDGRQLRGDGGESALGLRPQQRRAVWSALWRWPAHLRGCPTAASGAGAALSAVWPVRDAQRAVDRRGGSQPANIFR